MEWRGPKQFVGKMLAGLLIGIGFLLPGVSGGVMAVSMGIYEPMLSAVAHFFRDVRRNTRLLLPIVLGGAMGVLLTGFVLDWLMAYAQNQVMFLFIGLVAGGFPALWREANGRAMRRPNILALLLGIAAILLLAQMESSVVVAGVQGFGLWQTVLAGGIMAFGTVVPGISSSFVLIYLGLYEPWLNAITSLELLPLAAAAVGFVGMALLSVRAVEYLFQRYRELAYHAVMGFLLGSMFLIVPFQVLFTNWLPNLALIALGFCLTLWVNRGFGRKEVLP